MLVASLLDRTEALQVVAAALRGAVALVPLDHAPDQRTPEMIELQAPGLTSPLLLLGRLEGDAVAGMYPMRLKPLSVSHAAALRTFLRGRDLTTPPLGMAIVPEDEQAEPGPGGLYRIGSKREEPVVIPPAPEGLVREPLVQIDPEAERAADVGPLEIVFGAPVREAEGMAQGTEHAEALEEDKTVQEERPGVERSFAGRVLGGDKYFVQSHIGSGGSGRVYRGHHRELETTVAIKLLHQRHRDDDRFAARFRREARATSLLDHPNVMRVLDFGREEDGTMYIVMEYLDGPNLQRIVDVEAPLELPRIVGIMSQVCAALSAAHHVGIIHRDMKPENVVVMQRRDDDGSLADVVKVCDFGLAKIQEPAKKNWRKSSANLTIAGTVWGTPEYMSPEQVRDELLDPRSDVYSCGVILYEMATGQLPFTAESAMDIVIKQVAEEPVPPSRLVPDIDRGLEAAILRALSKHREDRQQSARELRAELRALLDPAARGAKGSGGWQPAGATPGDPGVFEDSLAKTSPHLKVSALADQIVERVARQESAASVEEVLDGEATVRAGGALDLALAILARQGDANALWTLVEWLDKVARDPDAESEPRQRAIATRALQTIADPEMLAEVARQLLTGLVEQQHAAREVLGTLGAAGAQALCDARLAATEPLHAAARARFVEAIRDMGTAAVSALGVTLAKLDPVRADAEPQLVEDLLRALPPDSSQMVAQLVLRHIRSNAPGVRRAAVEALALVLGAHAGTVLRTLVTDPDVAIRIAAFAGLRRIGAIDNKVVHEVARILSQSSDEALASTAAASLGAVIESDRPKAVAVLMRAIEPTGRVARLMGTARARLPDLVIETVAKTLVAIGGVSGRQAVRRRALLEKDPLRARLLALAGET